MYIHSQLELSKTKSSIRSITLTAMLLAILVIQEEILTFIPQVQLTVILIIVYARFLSRRELYFIVLAYVILDNMIMGSFNLLYTPAMFFSWMALAIIARAIRHKPDFVAFILAVIFPFPYGWSFLPATAIIQGFSYEQILKYLWVDVSAEMLMAASSVATYLFFYQPLKRLFYKLYKPKTPNNYIVF